MVLIVIAQSVSSASGKMNMVELLPGRGPRWGAATVPSGDAPPLRVRLWATPPLLVVGPLTSESGNRPVPRQYCPHQPQEFNKIRRALASRLTGKPREYSLLRCSNKAHLGECYAPAVAAGPLVV